MIALPALITTAAAIADRHPTILSAEELAAVLDAGERLESYLNLARSEAERRLENATQVPGWELAPGRARTSVVDAAAAFRSLAPLLTERAFLDCCNVALGKLVDAVRCAEGVTEDEAKDILSDYLKGNLLKTAGVPSLKRLPKCADVAALAQPEEAP